MPGAGKEGYAVTPIDATPGDFQAIALQASKRKVIKKNEGKMHVKKQSSTSRGYGSFRSSCARPLQQTDADPAAIGSFIQAFCCPDKTALQFLHVSETHWPVFSAI